MLVSLWRLNLCVWILLNKLSISSLQTSHVCGLGGHASVVNLSAYGCNTVLPVALLGHVSSPLPMPFRLTTAESSGRLVYLPASSAAVDTPTSPGQRVLKHWSFVLAMISGAENRTRLPLACIKEAMSFICSFHCSFKLPCSQDVKFLPCLRRRRFLGSCCRGEPAHQCESNNCDSHSALITTVDSSVHRCHVVSKG